MNELFLRLCKILGFPPMLDIDEDVKYIFLMDNKRLFSNSERCFIENRYHANNFIKHNIPNHKK